MTDPRIVQSAMQGHQPAMERLYLDTYSETYALAYHLLRNEEDALDVVQEAYVSALTNLNRLHDPAKFDVWVKQIVSNRCKDHFRKKKPDLFSDLSADEEGVLFEVADEDRAFRPDEALDYTETKRLVQGFLEELPEEQRMCLLMFYGSEMTSKEIADALSVPESTIKSRLNYGKQKLKEKVSAYEKKHNIRLHGAAPFAIFGFLRWMQKSVVVQPTAEAVSAVVQGATGAVSATATATAVTTVSTGVTTSTLGTIGKIVAGALCAGALSVGVVFATIPEPEPKQQIQTSESVMVEDVVDSDIPESVHVHDFHVTVIPPSCAKEGYTLRKCDCGECHKESYTEMVDHSFGEWIELERPSPYKDGEKGKFCVVCWEKISETLYYKPCIERGIDVFEVQAQAQAYIETLENAGLDPTKESGIHIWEISTVPFDTQEELLEHVKEDILYLYNQGMESHSSITMNVFVEEHSDCPGEYRLLPLYWIE